MSEASELEERRTRFFEEGSPFLPAERSEVVGIDNVLGKIDAIVHALKFASEYTSRGARLEPGVLFIGKPGTGKTLVARYIATVSSALLIDVRQFPHDQKFLTDSDIRRLFQLARESYGKTGRPVILFWDEFEGAAKERKDLSVEQMAAVSQLTAELDGVQGKCEGLLLVGCTNYAYLIDSALRRAGRMGVTIEFNPPGHDGRRLILDYYIGKILNTDKEIDTDTLAFFFRDGDTVAVMEEAVHDAWRSAIYRSFKSNKEPVVTEKDLINVCLDRMIGPMPTFIDMLKPRLSTVALHECGHGLTALVYDVPLRLITVRPSDSALGTTFTADVDPILGTVAERLNYLRVGCGGMVAEEVTGAGRYLSASGDTKLVTGGALDLVRNQGIGKSNGVYNPRVLRDSYYENSPNTSSDTISRVDADVRSLVTGIFDDVKMTLQAIGKDKITRMAEILIEEITMTGVDFTKHAECIIGKPRQYLPPQKAY